MMRVVIAADESLIRDGFRMILSSRGDFEVVGEASDGAEAIELAHLHRPDVVRKDVRMPHLDGIEATVRIVAANLPTSVLVLTTFNRDQYVYEALRAGAPTTPASTYRSAGYSPNSAASNT